MEAPASPFTDDVKPNVIWFMVDQMRAQAMSLVGDPNVNTPNLDRMARDGHYFRRALSGFPLCCPARGSMVTGQYPHKCVPGHEYPLPVELPTVADGFNEAGYHTAWFGKWHLGGYHEGLGRAAFHIVDPERRGRFATWVGYDNNNFQYDCWVHGHNKQDEVPLQRLGGHETEALTTMLLDEIESCEGKPFFAVCSVQPPHDPYTAPPEFAGRHNPATLELRPNVPQGSPKESKIREELAGYYALIEHIDQQVGRVMEFLDEKGLSDHTYLMFYSDHGDQHGSHGLMRKMTAYEESIRVPLMIWGGHRWLYRSRATITHPFNHVDLAPTSLGLCGIEPPEGMAGFDYSAVARGYGSATDSPTPARGPDLNEAPNSAYLQCVIPTGHGPSDDVPWRGIVTEDGWKYVAVPGQPLMLFNLNEDPYELCNLAFQSHARGKRLELNEKLKEWVKKTDDEFELPVFREDGRPVIIDKLKTKFADRWL